MLAEEYNSRYSEEMCNRFIYALSFCFSVAALNIPRKVIPLRRKDGKKSLSFTAEGDVSIRTDLRFGRNLLYQRG
jgi:hypothetical protein